MSSLKIALVGCCASGKSTVATRLHQHGFDAYSVAQEHSVIAELWKHDDPDVVVYLDVGLDSVRRRKSNPDWPSWIYDTQLNRLSSARENATLRINTDVLSITEVVSQIIDSLPASSTRPVDGGNR